MRVVCFLDIAVIILLDSSCMEQRYLHMEDFDLFFFLIIFGAAERRIDDNTEINIVCSSADTSAKSEPT